MRGNIKNGFTVIEVMLFLGITSLMVLMTFVGVGNSVNIQRYRDSVVSLQSILQQQYANVSNVIINARPAMNCSSTAITPTFRGQSSCVVLGKFITASGISPNDIITIKTIIGEEPTNIPTNEIDALYSFHPEVSAESTTIEQYQMKWGTTLEMNDSAAHNNATFSILIVRSPLTGIIRTFINNTQVVPDANIGNPGALIQIINNANFSADLKICVDSHDLFAGGKMAVMIASEATSANGVKTLGESDALNECQ